MKVNKYGNENKELKLKNKNVLSRRCKNNYWIRRYFELYFKIKLKEKKRWKIWENRLREIEVRFKYIFNSIF